MLDPEYQSSTILSSHPSLYRIVGGELEDSGLKLRSKRYRSVVGIQLPTLIAFRIHVQRNSSVTPYAESHKHCGKLKGIALEPPICLCLLVSDRHELLGSQLLRIYRHDLPTAREILTTVEP